jgi:hypothetical protein
MESVEPRKPRHRSRRIAVRRACNQVERLRTSRELQLVIQADNGPSCAAGRSTSGPTSMAYSYSSANRESRFRTRISRVSAALARGMAQRAHLRARDARARSKKSRIEYNRERPHSSLGALTPVEFAQLETGKLIPLPAEENNDSIYDLKGIGGRPRSLSCCVFASMDSKLTQIGNGRSLHRGRRLCPLWLLLPDRCWRCDTEVLTGIIQQRLSGFS